MHGHQEYGKQTLEDDRQCCINASANTFYTNLIHTKHTFNTYKIAILQVFDNNENTGEEIFASIVPNIAVDKITG